MDSAIQISENFIKGEPVKSVKHLMDLAYDKKSVYHSTWGIKPACVIINMNFSIVTRMINEKRIFTTIKLVKLKPNKK
jgi:hypothetical protein